MKRAVQGVISASSVRSWRVGGCVGPHSTFPGLVLAEQTVKQFLPEAQAPAIAERVALLVEQST